MEFFHRKKNKGNAEAEKTPQSTGKKFSRRTALKIATGEIATLAAVSTVDPKQIAKAALDASTHIREPVPKNLQKKTAVQKGETRRVGGYGDSIMAGYGNGDRPLTEREAEIAKKRRITLIPTANAKNGATTSDLVRQYKEERTKSDGKPLDEIQISAGSNNINNDKELKNALLRLSKNPFDLSAWLIYFSRKSGLRREVAKSLTMSIEEINRIGYSNAKPPDYVLFGTPPVQDARGINSIDPKTGKVTSIPLRGRGLFSTLKRAIAADLSRLGVRAAVDAGNYLQKKGVSVTVIDPAAAGIGPLQYNPNPDQHFDSQGANMLAERRVSLYEVK